MKHFRKRLAAEMRRRRGELTEREFARKLGITKATLHRIENKETNVTLDVLDRICSRLKCEIGELFPPVEKQG